MRFCPAHWDALREAIRVRGLNHLIAANGRDAFARMKAELEGRDEVDDYDPLMAAHWMIVSRATEWLGLAIFADNTCPVCEVLKNYPPIPEGHRYVSNESYWIEGPADVVLDECKTRGLVTPGAA